MKNPVTIGAVFAAASFVAGCDETNHNDIQSNSGDSHIHVEAGAHGAPDGAGEATNQSTARQHDPGPSEAAQKQATTQSNTPTPNTSVGRQEHP